MSPWKLTLISEPSHYSSLRQYGLKDWAVDLKEQERQIREHCPLANLSAYHCEQSEFKCDIRIGGLWPHSFSKEFKVTCFRKKHAMWLVGWKAQNFQWVILDQLCSELDRHMSSVDFTAEVSTACDMIRNINYQATNDGRSRFQTAYTFGQLGVMFKTNLFQRNALESVTTHFLYDPMFCCCRN